MVRRKSLRKEVVKLTAEGEESRVHFTLTKGGELETEIVDMSPNPEKISFGTIKSFDSSLEVATYRRLKGEYVYIFLNGEHIAIDRWKWRQMLSIWMKAGHYLGSIGSKKQRGLYDRLKRRAKNQ